ncbi:MAG TPA: NifU family protein [Nannocystaceae bacterium]|nr:NifU family protein [Nannocystaceae bacterium]
MIGTIARRATVKLLDVVVERGRRSKRAPVRVAAGALQRARALVGLGEVGRDAPLPQWSSATPDRPMWETDKKKLHKWQLERGIVKEEGAEAAAAVVAPAIEIYYKRGCPYARAAIELLREREIGFVEYDVKGNPEKLEWLKIVTGKKTTPQIFVHGKPIGGYEELRALDSAGELERMLAGGPSRDRAPVVEAEQTVDDDEISVEDLRERLDEQSEVLLLDVRTHAEADDTGMLAHAVLVPLIELEGRASELDREAVWIAYCKSGARSRVAVARLRAAGFRSVVSLAGGIEAWRASGGGVVRLGQTAPRTAPTRVRLPVVHPERSPFEMLADEWNGEAAAMLDGEELIARVREVLDECRPMIRQDGGDLELLDIKDDVVHVALSGNCIGCPSSQATLKQGIEKRLRLRIPQIKGVASPQLG